MAKRGTPPIRQLGKRIEGFLDDPAAELDAQLVAAREWIGLSGGEPRRFGEVSQRLPFHAEDWLFELPGFLVLAGRPADAQAIAHELAPVFAGPVILADLAVVLAENGHTAAARVEIEESARTHPDDAWVTIKCGDAWRRLGDVEAAEREYRRGLALAVMEDDSLTAEDAVERLAPYLEELGREAEARALRAWFEERYDAEIEDDPFAGAGAGAGAGDGGGYGPYDDDEFEPAVEQPVRRAGPKAGRNDPCPCGSGKKYKKCCAASDAAQAQDPSGTAVTRLIDELVKYGGRHVIWNPIDETKAAYFGDANAEVEESNEVQTFIEWLHLDAPTADGSTCAESYRARRGARLPAELRALLDSLIASHLGLYEVTAVRPGEGITLRDVLFGTTHDVVERLASRSLTRWDVLAARLVVSEGRLQMTGGVLPFRPAHKAGLLERLEDACGGTLPADARGLVRAAGVFQQHRVHLRHAPPPRLVTSDGSTLTFAKARWRVGDPDATRAALAAAPDFGREADGAFAWLPGEPGSAVGGRLALDGDVLTAECLSRERLERLEALVAARFPGARREGFATFTDPWHEVAARAGQPYGAKRPPAAVSPDIERVQRAALEAHYRAWIDEPVPALDGKTPRAAARDRALRPRLVDLVHQIENMSTHGSAVRPAFDCGWLRSELGIGSDE